MCVILFQTDEGQGWGKTYSNFTQSNPMTVKSTSPLVVLSQSLSISWRESPNIIMVKPEAMVAWRSFLYQGSHCVVSGMPNLSSNPLKKNL